MGMEVWKVIINIFFFLKLNRIENEKKRLEINAVSLNIVLETRGCQTCVVGQWNSISAVKLVHSVMSK